MVGEQNWQKPKCPICGSALRFRIKTKDYVCVYGHVTPLSNFTPLQPVTKLGAESVPFPGDAL